MTQTSQRDGGPIRLTARSATALRPATAGEITGGLWADRRRVNREVSIPGGWNRLHQAGNFHNLELAAGRATGSYVNDLPFLDSDVYKWLEAVAWALADPLLDSSLADRLHQQLAETERLLRDAQQSDGYLDSHFQVRFPGERFVQLPWGHELYCAGHLIQAAVALHRTSGDPGLLEVARRVADLIVDTFGTEAGKVDGVCGHPEIETALVELYRETGAGHAWNEPAISWTGVGTDYSAMAGLAGTTRRTIYQSGTPHRSKGTRSVSSTCFPGWPTCTWRPATPPSSAPWSGSGRRWWPPRPT